MNIHLIEASKTRVQKSSVQIHPLIKFMMVHVGSYYKRIILLEFALLKASFIQVTILQTFYFLCTISKFN